MVSGIRFRDGTVIDFQGTNVTIEVDEQNDTVTIANGQESFVFEANGDFSVPGTLTFDSQDVQFNSVDAVAITNLAQLNGADISSAAEGDGLLSDGNGGLEFGEAGGGGIETVSTVNDLPAVDPPQIAFVQSTGEYVKSTFASSFNVTEENLLDPVQEVFDVGQETDGFNSDYYTNDDTSKLFTFRDERDNGVPSSITEQTLGVPGDFTTLSDPFNAPFVEFNDGSTSDEITSGVSFNGDGTELISITDKEAFVHTLSSAYDLTTITLSSTPVDLSSDIATGTLSHLKFGPDGNNLYASNPDGLKQFVLSNPYDITSVSDSYTGSPFVPGDFIVGIGISPTGDELFLAEEDADLISIETMGTPFDVRTLNDSTEVFFDEMSFDGATYISLGFSRSGDRILLYNDLNAAWEQYNIGSPEGFVPL